MVLLIAISMGLIIGQSTDVIIIPICSETAITKEREYLIFLDTYLYFSALNLIQNKGVCL